MVQVTFKRQKIVNLNTLSPTWTGHRLGELTFGAINSTAIEWRGSQSFGTFLKLLLPGFRRRKMEKRKSARSRR